MALSLLVSEVPNALDGTRAGVGPFASMRKEIREVILKALSSGPKTTDELRRALASSGLEKSQHRYSALRNQYLEPLRRQGQVALIRECAAGDGGGLWEISDLGECMEPEASADPLEEEMGSSDVAAGEQLAKAAWLVPFKAFSSWDERPGTKSGEPRQVTLNTLKRIDLGWRESEYERFLAAHASLVVPILRSLTPGSITKAASVSSAVVLRQLGHVDLVIYDEGEAWLFELKAGQSAGADALAQLATHAEDAIRQLKANFPDKVKRFHAVLAGTQRPGSVTSSLPAWQVLEKACVGTLRSGAWAPISLSYATVSDGADGMGLVLARDSLAELGGQSQSPALEFPGWNRRRSRFRRSSSQAGLTAEVFLLTRRPVLKLSIDAPERTEILRSSASEGRIDAISSELRKRGERRELEVICRLGQRFEWICTPAASGDSGDSGDSALRGLAELADDYMKVIAGHLG